MILVLAAVVKNIKNAAVKINNKLEEKLCWKIYARN